MSWPPGETFLAGLTTLQNGPVKLLQEAAVSLLPTHVLSQRNAVGKFKDSLSTLFWCIYVTLAVQLLFFNPALLVSIYIRYKTPFLI